MFATNKTFRTAGTTSDTFEDYIATIGFELVRTPNATGGGAHVAIRMVTLSTEYTDEGVDRAVEMIAKADARADAQTRRDALARADREKELM